MPLFARTVLSPLALALAIAAPARAADAPPQAPLASPSPPEPMTATAAIAALHFPAATVTRLENGLTVVLEENHQSPYVSMRIRYDAGTRDDPAGKEGLALLTHHMMTRETKHVPTAVYDETLDRVGTTERAASTSLDEDFESVTVPPNGVASVLWLWSDQMGFFAPDANALLEARLAKKMRRDERAATPLGGVHEIVQRALFPEGHPYHSDPKAATSESVTLDDVRAFHDRFFAPNDAVLAVVGDFAAATVLEQIRTYFAPILPGPARPPAPLAPAQLEEEVRLDVAADVKAPEVWIDWRTPPFYAAGDAELDVAAREMVGSRVAALRWVLLDQKQVATRVTTRQISHALGSDFRITAAVAPGHTPEELLAAMDSVLGVFRKQGVNEPSFAGARANVTVPYVRALEHAAERATTYAELVTMHRDPKWIAGDVARYDATTDATVNATMARWLTKANRVVTVVTPDPSAPVGGVLRATRGAK